MICDALVIGGGPAGATIAQLLARAGWSVMVAEKAAFPRRKVCGEFMSATSMTLLDALGVGTAFAHAAGPDIRQVGLFARDATLTSAMPRVSASEFWGRALGRDRLDALLLKAAARAGARVRQPAKIVAVQRVGNAFACAIDENGTTSQVEARIVVAADGSWERGVVADIDTAHRPSDLLAFKAHFRGSALPRDLMPLIVFPGGYGGLVTSDDGRVSLSCCIRRDVLERCRRQFRAARAADAVLQHIFASCDGVRNALLAADLDGAWLAAGPIRPGVRARHRDGVFMVGNRAGEAHPIVAEGISMAAQSAWLLAQRLIARQDDIVAGRARDDVGARYVSDWDAAFLTRIRAAAAFAHLAMRPAAVALLLPMFRQFPAMLTFGAALSGKTRQVVAA